MTQDRRKKKRWLLGVGISRTGKDRKKEEIPIALARIIHECGCDAFETETRRSFSQVRPAQAYM
jgi:hypothetical protein